MVLTATLRYMKQKPIIQSVRVKFTILMGNIGVPYFLGLKPFKDLTLKAETRTAV